MTPESMPPGALTAVTEEHGESGANSSSPNSVAAVRVARASNCAFSISLSMPTDLMYFKRRVQRDDQRRVRRPARLAQRRVLLLLLQIEVVVRQVGGFGDASRLWG